MATYTKKSLKLREGQEVNVAADTDSSNSTPQQAVQSTKQANPSATKVTVPAREIDGSTNTQTSTLKVQNNAEGYKMAKDFSQKNPNANVEFDLNSVKRSGSLVEGIQFTKSELSDFLRSL